MNGSLAAQKVTVQSAMSSVEDNVLRLEEQIGNLVDRLQNFMTPSDTKPGTTGPGPQVPAGQIILRIEDCSQRVKHLIDRVEDLHLRIVI